MKNLRGYSKGTYFKLSTISMYSTLSKLHKREVNFIYHIVAYYDRGFNKDPP